LRTKSGEFIRSTVDFLLKSHGQRRGAIYGRFFFRGGENNLKEIELDFDSAGEFGTNSFLLEHGAGGRRIGDRGAAAVCGRTLSNPFGWWRKISKPYISGSQPVPSLQLIGPGPVETTDKTNRPFSTYRWHGM
jgi:hypothetical protein